MKKTTVYQVEEEYDNFSVKEIEAYVFINPTNKKKVWLMEDEESARSYYLSEFEEYDFFLTKKEAIKRMEEKRIKEDDFLKICIDFMDKCEKYNESNPFIDLGKYYARKSNKSFIEKITDPIYKHFAYYHLETSEYLSGLCKKLLPKLEKS